jgi:hypothetical protein
MFLIRDLMFCKPGKTRPIVDKMKAVAKLTESAGFGRMRVMTDVSAERFWTVISEIEVPNLDAFSEGMKKASGMKEFQDVMKDYHDFVDSGRREIYTLEN